MLLINSIKKSFGCVIENPSITLFLVLFLIGLNIVASYILTAKIRIVALILILAFFALFFVFLSGWFKVIRETTDREKIKEKNFYALFLEGIGEYIIPTSMGVLIYILCMFLTIFLAQFIALNLFGDINFFLDKITQPTPDNNNLAQYFNSLDDNQKYVIYGWNLCIMFAFMILNFISMFYFPSVLACQKNIFLRALIGIWDSLKFLFKNFFPALGLGLFICILHMILAILNAKFAQNPILSIILLFLYIYFISYVVMLIFNYYEEKNNCSDRTDGVGEDKTIDSAGEEN